MQKLFGCLLMATAVVAGTAEAGELNLTIANGRVTLIAHDVTVRQILDEWARVGQTKIDRYGKKYSWIAYFEMWGQREAGKELPDWKMGTRTSDCGVDPSFPKSPLKWDPPIPNLFGDLAIGTEAWVESKFTPDWSSLPPRD